MKKAKNFIVSAIRENSFSNRPFLAMSFFMVLTLLSPFINILFEIKPDVHNFSQHIISNASINNLDIAKRVKLFYWTLVGIFLLSGIVFISLKRLTAKIKEENALLSNIYSISIIGILTFFSGILMYQTDSAMFFIVVVLLFVFMDFRSAKNTKIVLALWPVLVAFPMALLGYTFLKYKNFFGIVAVEQKIRGHLISLEPQPLIFVALLFFIALLSYKIRNSILNKKSSDSLLFASLPIVLAPVVVSLLLEFLNIFNVRFDIVYNHPFQIFTVMILVSIGLFYLLLKSKKDFNKKIVQRYFIALCLLGYVILMAQPYRYMVPGKEFFESANHGIAVDHLFRYGSIPFVENFDAHMLNQQLLSYVYVFLNGYEPWSHSLYVFYFYVLEIIVLYFVFRKVLGDVNSFILLLCVPVLPVILNEFALAGLFALYIIKILQNPKPKNFYGFWILGIVLCLYKLDVGYGALLSGIIIYFLFNKLQHNRFDWKPFLKSAVIVIVLLVVLFAVLCLAKSINPITRLQEFLLAAMSDQNWGIAKMGNTSNYLFRISYYILPIVTATYAVYILFKLLFQSEFWQGKRNHPKIVAAIVFFLYFFLFFVFNAQRGIVFHNFEYGNIIRITSTIPIALLFLTLLFNGKNKLVYFSVVFLGMFLFLNSANPDFKNRSASLLAKSINSGSFHEKFTEMYSFNGSRLRVGYDESELNFFRNFLDASLAKDESYYDFSSTNLFHVLTGRKNPVYINQSPLMLNGDKAQDFELGYLKKKNISVVLMPIKNNYWHAISEVYVDFKYYKIAEYVYANFTPLYRNSAFDVYVLKSKKAYFESKLKSLGQQAGDGTLTDFNFIKEDVIQKNNLLVENSGSAITLKSNGTTPYVIGIVDYLRKSNRLKNEDAPAKLHFSFDASNAGNIKMYFRLSAADAFSEENMKEFPITAAGNNEIYMDFTKIPFEMMIAINVTSITPKSFQFISQSQGIISEPEKIDYNIGFVPKLWAENSEQPDFSNVKALDQAIEETKISLKSKNLNKTKVGVFAYYELESPVDIMATVDLSVNDVSRASYRLCIMAGKHQYALRVSNGFYWWNSTNPKIILTADNLVKVTKCSLITEDGRTAIDYKSDGLTLANLTDENWKNGCSASLNMILLNYSPAKENLLKQYKKIKLIDGRIVTVKSYAVSGNYINVTLVENVQEYVEGLQYPNALEFIK